MERPSNLDESLYPKHAKNYSLYVKEDTDYSWILGEVESVVIQSNLGKKEGHFWKTTNLIQFLRFLFYNRANKTFLGYYKVQHLIKKHLWMKEGVFCGAGLEELKVVLFENVMTAEREIHSQ